MIENKNNASRNLEKVLQALKQAQQRVANEKKKQNEKKRKAEKPLPHNPRSPMPKTKARAIRNDKGVLDFHFLTLSRYTVIINRKRIHETENEKWN